MAHQTSEETYPQPFESAFPHLSSQPHETGSQSLAPTSTFNVLYGEGSRAAAGRRRAPFDDCADVCRVPFRRWVPIVSRRELDSLMTAPAGQLIPSPGDQNLWAQSLRPMDMMSQGRSVSLFHASQQWSRMSP